MKEEGGNGKGERWKRWKRYFLFARLQIFVIWDVQIFVSYLSNVSIECVYPMNYGSLITMFTNKYLRVHPVYSCLNFFSILRCGWISWSALYRYWEGWGPVSNDHTTHRERRLKETRFRNNLNWRLRLTIVIRLKFFTIHSRHIHAHGTVLKHTHMRCGRVALIHLSWRLNAKR